jgi:hypothetical protein
MLKGGIDSSSSLTYLSIFEDSPASLVLGIVLISLDLSIKRLGLGFLSWS